MHFLFIFVFYNIIIFYTIIFLEFKADAIYLLQKTVILKCYYKKEKVDLL